MDEIIFEALMVKIPEAGEFGQNSEFINGLPDFTCSIREHIKVHESKMIRVRSIEGDTLQEVEFYNFPPGSAVALR